MKIKLDKKLPQNVAIQAMEILNDVDQGLIRPKKLNANGALSVRIGRSYRAIKYKRSDQWFVCSHEKYNKICERKH